MSSKNKSGVRPKFIALLGGLGLAALLVIGIASYKFSMQAAMNEAKTKGELIANYIFSARKYFHDTQRPLINELLEKDRFYPELMSEFVVAKETWEIFKESLPGYEFKQATINPLQPDNKADEAEARIINTFRDNAGLTKQEGILSKNDEKYYYLAKPIRIDSKDCLDCHGDPGDAPKDQVVLYGEEGGYNWKMGETISADIVYIPIKQALSSVKTNALMILLSGGSVLVVALFIVWVFLNNRIVMPIVRLSNRAKEISLGKNLEEEIDLRDAKDEIGSLAQAIDRLRVSMHKMLTRK
ncbi:MAG: DUF3365 domain-containing protein [Proteobacteria bacterium]|nr:DUF3365 domain-containing protein [Pseudomonadota bacterium]MBU1709912.1 DUF3365 domain-containing protein [Pseudomonadota bacterium]